MAFSSPDTEAVAPTAQFNPQLITCYEDLLQLFIREQLPYQADPSVQQIILPTALKSLNGELMILWDAQNNLVQCIHPLPFEVPVDRSAAAESAIAWINHALVIPGFGFNHEARLLYYRLSQPQREDGTLTVKEMQRLVQTCIQTTESFNLALQQVVLDAMNPDQVLTYAAAHQTEASEPLE
jgi:hypothetical protein